MKKIILLFISLLLLGLCALNNAFLKRKYTGGIYSETIANHSKRYETSNTKNIEQAQKYWLYWILSI